MEVTQANLRAHGLNRKRKLTLGFLERLKTLTHYESANERLDMQRKYKLNEQADKVINERK